MLTLCSLSSTSALIYSLNLKLNWQIPRAAKHKKINFGDQQKTGGHIACSVPCTSHENINNIANIIITVLHYRVAAFSGPAFSALPRLLHFGEKLHCKAIHNTYGRTDRCSVGCQSSCLSREQLVRSLHQLPQPSCSPRDWKSLTT